MRVEDWGLIEYASAVERQLATVDAVASGAVDEVLVFCAHPAVVTLGRATTADDLTGWKGAVVTSSRGGRATYHGPSQLVVYPILDLRRRDRDVHRYLRGLERAVVSALHAVGLASAEARTAEVGGLSLTGVWVGAHKIASLGIAVRKWITYHGVAINLTEDPEAFRGIRPCGFSADAMTNVARALGHEVSRAKLKEALTTAIRAEIRVPGSIPGSGASRNGTWHP